MLVLAPLLTQIESTLLEVARAEITTRRYWKRSLGTTFFFMVVWRLHFSLLLLLFLVGP